MDYETLPEKKVNELRKGLEDVLTRRSAVLGNAATNCLDGFAGAMFSHGFITKEVREHPSFDKILHEFTSILRFHKTLKELEDSCKVFVDNLQRCGGPLQPAARDLTERWSDYARENFKVNFILKAPQQERTRQSLEHHRHQTVGHSNSQGSFPSYLFLQPMPSSSAMLGRHMRRHPSIQKAVVDQFNPHTHQPLTDTWNKHYSNVPLYEVPVLVNERTRGGAWEVPSRPLPSEPLTEDSKFSISDLSVRCSDPTDSSPLENGTIPENYTVSSLPRHNGALSSASTKHEAPFASPSSHNDLAVPETEDQTNLEPFDLRGAQPLVPTDHSLYQLQGRLDHSEGDQLYQQLLAKDDEIKELEQCCDESEGKILKLQNHVDSLQRERHKSRQKQVQEIERLKRKTENQDRGSKERENALVSSHKGELAKMEKKLRDKSTETSTGKHKTELAILKKEQAIQKKELQSLKTADRETRKRHSILEKEKNSVIRRLEGKLGNSKQKIKSCQQERENTVTQLTLLEASRAKERHISLIIFVFLSVVIVVLLLD